MKAIVPDGSEGIVLLDVPEPQAFPNAILCRTTHTLISPGTERSMIRRCTGETPWHIFTRGVRLGYNGIAVVEQSPDPAGPFSPGRKVVIYGGPWVFHAERLAVPRRLAVPLPNGLEPECAVFAGLCAISLHGLRMGRTALGDVCVVAGLGVIGNLCAQLALQAGCRVIASDLDPSRREVFLKCLPEGSDALTASQAEVDELLTRISDGRGADVVFPCMSTKSDQPVKDALRQVRPGGRIIILGDMDIRIPRDEFFVKEAEVSCSRAAGPGRYDPVFERDGVNYPAQYVRWTEDANLAESVRLLAAGKVRVQPMISSVIPVSEAPEAYKRLMSGGPEIGVILKWE